MQTYQIDTSISEKGVIKLPEMPHLYNKKVKLIIISSEENTTEFEQRKQAMERLLKRQNTMPISHWTDEELDNIRYECLKEKHQ
jgi:maleate cis-trans isomerase